jgi:hypothetical protein
VRLVCARGAIEVRALFCTRVELKTIIEQQQLQM